MNRRLLAILSITFIISGAAFGQGTGSTAPGSGPSRINLPSTDERPFAVTRTVTGTVAEIKDDGKLLVLTDKKGKNHEFKADAKMKMKGGDKMAKDDKMMMKSPPSFSELQIGQMVKVTYREADHTATQVTPIMAKK